MRLYVAQGRPLRPGSPAHRAEGTSGALVGQSRLEAEQAALSSNAPPPPCLCPRTVHATCWDAAAADSKQSRDRTGAAQLLPG